MWFWRTTYNPTAYDDDWEDQPTQGGFYKWGLGVALPGLILAYGIAAVVMKETVFYDDRASMPLHGTNAIALGVAAISLAVFLHCHYFWGNIYDQAWFAVLGKIISMCGLITGLVMLIIRVGVLGIG
jgi:hypothetical protein